VTLLTTYICKGSLAGPEGKGRKSFPYQQYLIDVFINRYQCTLQIKSSMLPSLLWFLESSQEVARPRLKNSNGNETVAQKTVQEVKQSCPL